jgi:hypothetical protein
MAVLLHKMAHHNVIVYILSQPHTHSLHNCATKSQFAATTAHYTLLTSTTCVPHTITAQQLTQAELADERALTYQLGRDLEDPTNAARWRELGGTDLDTKQLHARIAVLESRLG